MTFNKRIAWVIVPVISISFAVIIWSIFEKQSRELRQAHLAQARLDASTLAMTVDRYANFGKGFTASFLQSNALKAALMSNDPRYRSMSIERNLDRIIEDYSPAGFSGLKLVMLNAEQDVEFSYDNGDDPFAEIDSSLLYLTRAFSSAPSEESSLWLPDSHSFMIFRHFNRETLRTPQAGDPFVVTIGLMFELTSFIAQRDYMQLEYGYEIELLTKAVDDIGAESNRLVKRNQLHVLEPLNEELAISLMLDLGAIEHELKALKARLASLYFFLVGTSAMALFSLIHLYVIKPIKVLEADLHRALDSGLLLPEYFGGQSEINSLGRMFSRVQRQSLEAYQEMKQLAEVDSLTKLKNRYTFGRHLEALLDDADLETTKFALLYIDLDNFKEVNDSFGHDAGDALLCEFSEALVSMLRVSRCDVRCDIVARLAGDEFAILLTDFSSEDNVHLVCERILGLFDQGFETSLGRYPVSASIGVARYPHDGDTAFELTRNADAAMYQAKEAGRKKYFFYSFDLAEKVRRERAIESALKEGVFDQFSLHYMPIVDAKTGVVKSVEALLRWHSQTLGLVGPMEFIPIAESLGLFDQVDMWVINRALDELNDVRAVFGERVKISINISSAQLNSSDFFLNLMLCFQRRSIKYSAVQLEITETFATDMSSRVESNLALLKQAGLTLALDDFGTGYTSLTQLVDYPLDVIKIDKSLIDRMLDPGRRDMVLALVSFCKQQGFEVAVEGVETVEQADALSRAGADSLQGYFIAKPQPLEMFADAPSTPYYLPHSERSASNV